jgi:hypothetical protein
MVRRYKMNSNRHQWFEQKITAAVSEVLTASIIRVMEVVLMQVVLNF